MGPPNKDRQDSRQRNNDQDIPPTADIHRSILLSSGPYSLFQKSSQIRQNDYVIKLNTYPGTQLYWDFQTHVVVHEAIPLAASDPLASARASVQQVCVEI